MVNQVFSQLSQEEKREKLQEALRCMTNDRLTGAELRAICHAVRLERQYFIRVHHTFEGLFTDIMHLVQRKTRFIIGSCIASQRNLESMLERAAQTGEPVTAVVDHTNGKSGIYILIPEQEEKKGTTP